MLDSRNVLYRFEGAIPARGTIPRYLVKSATPDFDFFIEVTYWEGVITFFLLTPCCKVVFAASEWTDAGPHCHNCKQLTIHGKPSNYAYSVGEQIDPWEEWLRPWWPNVLEIEIVKASIIAYATHLFEVVLPGEESACKS